MCHKPVIDVHIFFYFKKELILLCKLGIDLYVIAQYGHEFKGSTTNSKRQHPGIFAHLPLTRFRKHG